MRALIAGIALFVALAVAPPALADRLIVFAAASSAALVDAVVNAAKLPPDVTVATSYAASSTLARQIDLGAPADIFISANRKWIDHLIAGDKISAGDIRAILSNRLALAGAAADGGMAEVDLADLPALLADDRLAMADPDHVPLGLYGKQALAALGLWPDIAPRVVRLANARAVVATVARGEARFGITYASDLIVHQSIIRIADISPEVHGQITYFAAIVTGRETEAVRLLFDAFTPARLEKVAIQFGFTPISDGD